MKMGNLECELSWSHAVKSNGTAGLPLYDYQLVSNSNWALHRILFLRRMREDRYARDMLLHTPS